MKPGTPSAPRTDKFFVSSHGSATIACPECGITKQLPVTRFRGKKHTIQVGCSCGLKFSVQLEFRKAYRKPTDLPGTYKILSENAGGGTVSIQNISRTGIGFTVSGLHNIRVGHHVQLSFNLDNRKATKLQKIVVIRSVKGNMIGCEFIDQQAFEKDLGFYLQP